MKKSIYLLFLLSLLLGIKTNAQQEKLAALVFTTTSNEALLTFNAGLKFNDRGEGKKARALFEKAVQQDPKFAAALLYLAQNATSPQEFEALMGKAKEYVAQSSEWEKLFYAYNETFLTENQNKRLETAQKMVAMFPNNARSFILLGQAYSNKNDFANARKNFQQAITVEPSSPLGYRSLAESYLFEEPKDFKKAEQNANKLVSLMPSGAGYILLGDTYRAQNNLQKAKDSYAKAVAADAENPTALYKRGHANSFLGEFAKAREDYEKAATLDVVNTFAIGNIANTYLYEGKPEKAIKYLLDEASKPNKMEATKSLEHMYNLLSTSASIAYHMNDQKKLMSILQMLEPLAKERMNNFNAAEAKLVQKAEWGYWKACALTLAGNYTEAKSVAEDMKTVLDPIQSVRKLEGYEFVLGQINYREKNYREALSHFEKTDKANVYNVYWVARTYDAMGDSDKARALYKEIADYNFNNLGYALIRNEVKQKM
jgi:tetratricopeptide (TPR) repeat protein